MSEQVEASKQSRSIAAKHYTYEIARKLAGVLTPDGSSLDWAFATSIHNAEDPIGIYAPHPAAYDLWAALLNGVIRDRHGFDPETEVHMTDFGTDRIPTEPIPGGDAIVSTRVRVGRNLAGYAFASAVTEEDRLEIMHKIAQAVSTFDGDLAGTFHPLEGMDQVVKDHLIADHFMFREGDDWLNAAGANRHWPSGRGIFHNEAKTALVWANEEDELRIISMQKGGDLLAVFDRLSRMVKHLEQHLDFAMHPVLGALTSCPTNLGTAMRASVHVKLPKLLHDMPRLKGLAADLGLDVRGTDGEHSKGFSGVADISNLRRLGLSEQDAAILMYNGVAKLIEIENSL